MTPLERCCEAYANAFRDGFMRVGGGKDYPLWSQYHPDTRAETMRCMAYAIDVVKRELKDPLLDALFPEPLTKRATKPSKADAEMAERLKG